MTKTRLPDWEVVDALVDNIANSTKTDILLEAEYDYTKSQKIRAALNSEGKVSATAVLATINDDPQLNELRKKIAQSKSQLKKYNLQFDVIKMQIDLYRTESANARNTS